MPPQAYAQQHLAVWTAGPAVRQSLSQDACLDMCQTATAPCNGLLVFCNMLQTGPMRKTHIFGPRLLCDINPFSARCNAHINMFESNTIHYNQVLRIAAVGFSLMRKTHRLCAKHTPAFFLEFFLCMKTGPAGHAVWQSMSQDVCLDMCQMATAPCNDVLVFSKMCRRRPYAQCTLF